MPQHPSFRRYFIAIGIPEPENTFLAQIRELYHPQHHLTSPPHITLKPPFQMPNRSYLLEKLAKVARYLEPFTVKLDMIGSFRQPKYGTIFLEPQKGEQIKQIERTLSENIAFLPTGRTFYPHLTLAQQVKHDDMKKVKHQLRALNIGLKLKVDALVLYVQNEDGQWEVDQIFPFGQNNSDKHQTKSDDDEISANPDHTEESQPN